jgi:PIN domain
MRRKLRMSWRETRESLALLRGLLDVAPVTVGTHDLGLEFAERYGLSIYDSMIAAAAALNGSARLWSQDMKHGMLVGVGLRVRILPSGLRQKSEGSAGRNYRVSDSVRSTASTKRVAPSIASAASMVLSWMSEPTA